MVAVVAPYLPAPHRRWNTFHEDYDLSRERQRCKAEQREPGKHQFQFLEARLVCRGEAFPRSEDRPSADPSIERRLDYFRGCGIRVETVKSPRGHIRRCPTDSCGLGVAVLLGQ